MFSDQRPWMSEFLLTQFILWYLFITAEEARHFIIPRLEDMHPGGSQRQIPKRMLSSMCILCKKMFASPSHLNIHMRVHTGDRPFACEVCDVKFNTKGNLKRHMIKHMK